QDTLAYMATPMQPIERVVEGSDFLASCYTILLSNTENLERGRKDFEVLSRWLLGQSLDEIGDACQWVSGSGSVRYALRRIIHSLREGLGADVNAPLDLRHIEDLRQNPNARFNRKRAVKAEKDTTAAGSLACGPQKFRPAASWQSRNVA